jgi:hypothetical protein
MKIEMSQRTNGMAKAEQSISTSRIFSHQRPVIVTFSKYGLMKLITNFTPRLMKTAEPIASKTDKMKGYIRK